MRPSSWFYPPSSLVGLNNTRRTGVLALHRLACTAMRQASRGLHPLTDAKRQGGDHAKRGVDRQVFIGGLDELAAVVICVIVWVGCRVVASDSSRARDGLGQGARQAGPGKEHLPARKQADGEAGGCSLNTLVLGFEKKTAAPVPMNTNRAMPLQEGAEKEWHGGKMMCRARFQRKRLTRPLRTLYIPADCASCRAHTCGVRGCQHGRQGPDRNACIQLALLVPPPACQAAVKDSTEGVQPPREGQQPARLPLTLVRQRCGAG